MKAWEQQPERNVLCIGRTLKSMLVVVSQVEDYFVGNQSYEDVYFAQFCHQRSFF